MDNVKGIEYRSYTIISPMGRYFVYGGDMSEPLWHDTTLSNAKEWVDNQLSSR